MEELSVLCFNTEEYNLQFSLKYLIKSRLHLNFVASWSALINWLYVRFTPVDDTRVDSTIYFGVLKIIDEAQPVLSRYVMQNIEIPQCIDFEIAELKY